MARFQCKICNETKSSLDFLRSRALWFPNGVSDICESCLESRIDSRDLNKVDKILQYLDILFNTNEWMDMYESNGDRTLGVYVTKFFAQKSNRNIDWTEVNNVWREKQKNNTLNKEINVIAVKTVVNENIANEIFLLSFLFLFLSAIFGEFKKACTVVITLINKN